MTTRDAAARCRIKEDLASTLFVEAGAGTGKTTALVGASGAGKSTLLKILIGEEKPTEGKVLFLETDIGSLGINDMSWHRRRIGTIFQDFKLLETKTVGENVAFAMEVVGKSGREIREVVPQALKLVGLEGREHRFPKEISGGEKQRVAIARALVHNPDLIIADEPTGNLDPVTAWDIIRLLSRINKVAGTGVILATHNKDIVNALQKRVVMMEDGKIMRDDESGRYAL
ncbi:MAG: ATP-binding cassette domain-containing protein [Chloroflexi bacterium]|nr:ATP-binding cassette domain-containing protein [Chloroflexota bacterium]